MAGLEPLYTCNRDRIICADDAVVFLVHWVLTTAGYRCIGSGNQARSSDERSELLPSDWNSNNEVYTLRYKHTDTDTPYMLICIPIEGDLLVNFVSPST
ncbi:proteasome inhibitor PI31 subunit-like [Eucyclogobius newberryi]|uniref:proteasome inhibitor PI31 subunit-like n=1 Tax=Eucyclogobius newberryi TaxID=166745 RepID=UPI003B5B8BC1